MPCLVSQNVAGFYSRKVQPICIKRRCFHANLSRGCFMSLFCFMTQPSGFQWETIKQPPEEGKKKRRQVSRRDAFEIKRLLFPRGWESRCREIINSFDAVPRNAIPGGWIFVRSEAWQIKEFREMSSFLTWSDWSDIMA